MKQQPILSLFLTAALTLSLTGPALADGETGCETAPPAKTGTLLTAADTRPSWCPAEEYVTFPGSAAYEGDNWTAILSLREHAAGGGLKLERGDDPLLYNRQTALNRITGDPGVSFELGLLSVQYALNAAQQGKKISSTTAFEMAAARTDDPQAKYLCQLWNARMRLASDDLSKGLEGGLRFFAGAVEPLLARADFTMEALYDSILTPAISPENLRLAKEVIFVTLDGELVHPRSVRVRSDYLDTTTAQTRSWRTMVPIRRLAELMGATVDYDGTDRSITIHRGSDSFVMTLGSTTALRNGTAFQMDVAPYSENYRTYIPIRYIAEFFGQNVTWIGGQQHVRITEDKAPAEGSNLESWALAMGLLLNYENNPKEAHLFGGKRRFGAGPVGGTVSNRLETTGPDFGRTILAESWNITDRAGLQTIAAELARSTDAWDLFRVSNLAQWGYLAGYVTYTEALGLVEPAARGVAKHYSSWKTAYKDYLTGYCRWARLDTADVWSCERGQLYETVLADGNTASLLDDSLFSAGVLPLPA